MHTGRQGFVSDISLYVNKKREISDNFFMVVSGEKIVFRIDELLDKKGLSRPDACRYAKINLRAMNDWGKKGTIPAADALYAIANFLQTTVEYLITGKDGLSEGERELLGAYNLLNEVGKDAAIGAVKGLIARFPLPSEQAGASSRTAT